MTRRTTLAKELCVWVGRDSLELIDPRSGWPAQFRARALSEWTSTAIYLGLIGLSRRNRDDVERRFQNPGKDRPIAEHANEVPLLLGLYELDGTRLLVGMDPRRRIGRQTRHSLFMPLHLLRSSGAWGWAEHFSESGERLIAFRPELLPIYVELCRVEALDASKAIEAIVAASGANDAEAGPDAITRAIDAAARIVGERVFSRRVSEAYERRCAMCGLDILAVEGIHIYPAAAPACQHEVWNGVALCAGHRSAFDSFLIHVDTESRRLRFHPGLSRRARATPASQAFIDTTFEVLRTPSDPEHHPAPEMFEKRYRFFKPMYDWA